LRAILPTLCLPSLKVKQIKELKNAQASINFIGANSREAFDAAVNNTMKGKTINDKVIIVVDKNTPEEWFSFDYPSQVQFKRDNQDLDLSADGIRKLTGAKEIKNVDVVVSRHAQLSPEAIQALNALTGSINLYLLLDDVTRLVVPLTTQELDQLANLQRLISTQA
jgi:hypothetical protein